MKVDFNKHIVDLDGQDIDNGGKPWILKDACTRAIFSVLEEDKGLTGEQSFARLELARRINAGGEVEVTPEEAVLLRARAAKVFNVLAAGQVFEALKG
jgi:hypothetical protein